MLKTIYKPGFNNGFNSIKKASRIPLKNEEETETTIGGSHTLFKIEVPSTKNYKLYIGSFEHNEAELDNMFMELENANDDDTLEISIHSSGGLLSELQRFENIIKNIFTRRTTTFLNPYGFSAGAMIFVMGDYRVVFENSQLMFHDFSGGFYGKSYDMKNQIDFDYEFLKNYFTKIVSPFLNKKELQEFFSGKEFWFNAEEMLRRNIATHICINGDILEAKEYLKSIEKPEKPEKPEKSTKSK